MTAALLCRLRHAAGATLIEMVVSLFVMGVGMMGVLGLQTQAMRSNHQAHAYSQAVFLSQEILERMRANRLASQDYVVGPDERIRPRKNCGAPNADCTAAQLRDWDIANWQAAIARRLPAGQGHIRYHDNQLQIVLEFDLTASAGKKPAPNTVERQRYLLNAGL